MARKDPDKYIGRWRETSFDHLNLPFAKASLRNLLREGASPESSISHQRIADWCERFYIAIAETDTGDEPSADLLDAAEIALDVDAQWGLYLVNTFSLAELQSLDFATVQLPYEWFSEWLEELGPGAARV